MAGHINRLSQSKVVYILRGHGVHIHYLLLGSDNSPMLVLCPTTPTSLIMTLGAFREVEDVRVLSFVFNFHASVLKEDSNQFQC